MSVCAVAAYDTVLLACEFGWVVGADETINLLLLHFDVLLLLLGGHDEAPVGYKLVLRL